MMDLLTTALLHAMSVAPENLDEIRISHVMNGESVIEYRLKPDAEVVDVTIVPRGTGISWYIDGYRYDCDCGHYPVCGCGDHIPIEVGP